MELICLLSIIQLYQWQKGVIVYRLPEIFELVKLSVVQGVSGTRDTISPLSIVRLYDA